MTDQDKIALKKEALELVLRTFEPDQNDLVAAADAVYQCLSGIGDFEQE